MEPYIAWTTSEDDERNAPPFMPPPMVPPRRVGAGRRPWGMPINRQPVMVYPTAPASVPYVPGVGYVQGYNPAHPMPVPSTPAAKLAALGTPTLIEGAAKLLASFLPVPPAPPATGDVADDVANVIIFNSELAAHAKRDEQIRTLGWLAAQLLG